MFCPNTGTKFREAYHSNHVIPRFDVINIKIIQSLWMTYSRSMAKIILFHDYDFLYEW